MQRTPDQGGYNAWVAALATNSRTVVRNGFAFSSEFQSNVVQLCAGTSTSAALKYVLTDEKGSARVLMENNGTSSAILSRHDYLPFGEEIWAGVGLRTTTQKYANTDKVRQRFAMTERDETTGLDHTWFRKYESMAGRWTSPDALGGSIGNPQSFNRYAYVGNDPINFFDPLGLDKSGQRPGSGEKEGFPDGIDEWVDIFAGSDTGVVIESGPTFGSGPSAPGGPSVGPDLMPGGGPGADPGGKDPETNPGGKAPLPTNCEAFARMLQFIADSSKTVDDFLDTLARPFTAANNASISEMRRSGYSDLPTDRPAFTDTGFRRDFRDGTNQVRHFVGGFIAGAVMGVTPGLAFMDAREYMPQGTNEDINLNQVSVDMGARYGANFMVGIGTIRRELVDEFRKRLCQ